MTKDFNGTLFKSIDETMAGVLGLKARDILYLNLLTKRSITREELPTNPRSLVSVLEESFGPNPAKNVLKAIAKRFSSEMGMEFIEKPDFSFLDYVQEVRSIRLNPSQPKRESTDETED
jgi:hypothetical protein